MPVQLTAISTSAWTGNQWSELYGRKNEPIPWCLARASRQPQFGGLENLRLVGFAAGGRGRHFCPPLVAGFAWLNVFSNHIGNDVICPLFNGLKIELCFCISELAGSKLCWLKCVESTHYGYELNFQPIQPEAFIQASSNGPSRSEVNSVLTPYEQGPVNCADPERQRDCHYDNPFQHCAISTAAGFVFSLHSVLLIGWYYIQQF